MYRTVIIRESYRNHTGFIPYSYGMHVVFIWDAWRKYSCTAVSSRVMPRHVLLGDLSDCKSLECMSLLELTLRVPIVTLIPLVLMHLNRSCAEPNTHPTMGVLVCPHVHSPMTMIGYRCGYVVEHRLSMAPRP